MRCRSIWLRVSCWSLRNDCLGACPLYSLPPDRSGSRETGRLGYSPVTLASAAASVLMLMSASA